MVLLLLLCDEEHLVVLHQHGEAQLKIKQHFLQINGELINAVIIHHIYRHLLV
jgi:hypothetical protein